MINFLLILTFLASWFFTDRALYFSEFIHMKLAKSPISWISNVVRILLTGITVLIFFIFISYFVSLDFLVNYMTHNAGDENTPNPYEFTVSSKYFDKSVSFDVRLALDTALAAGVGKTTVMAVKAAPAPFKAGVAAATALSVGTVALAFRNSSYGVEQARSATFRSGNNSITLESTPKPSSSSNSGSSSGGGPVANYPSEDFNVFDTMCSILMCTKVLVIISLVVIIVAVVMAYVVSSGHKLQGKSNFTIINRFTSYALKAGYLYSFICTGLACFNLIWSLYFINKLIEMVKILSGS